MGKKKALLIRLSALGDVIFNLPLANILQKNGYELHWITSEKGFDIINNNPLVDKAILAPVEKWKKQSFLKNIVEYFKIISFLRSQKYDIAIDTQLLLKSAIWTAFSGAKRRIVSKSAREFAHLAGNEIIEKLSYDYNTHATKRYLKFSEYLGLQSDEIVAKLPKSSQKSIDKIDELTKELDKTKPIIGIAPATTWKTKHWNKDNWKALVKELEKDFTIVFTGTKKDCELIEYISEGRFLNIVSIFCSTPKGFYAPIGREDKYIALSGNLSCQPCHKKHCPFAENTNGCTRLPEISEVLNSVYRLLPIKEEI